MTVPHTYPGTWGARYDALQAEAWAAGVCIKIVDRGTFATMWACGRERTKGLYCERHQR